MARLVIVVTLLLSVFVCGALCGRGQEYRTTDDEGEGQKSYEQEEEGKVLPAR